MNHLDFKDGYHTTDDLTAVDDVTLQELRARLSKEAGFSFFMVPGEVPFAVAAGNGEAALNLIRLLVADGTIDPKSVEAVMKAPPTMPKAPKNALGELLLDVTRKDPEHTDVADVVFFQVGLDPERPVMAEALRQAITEHRGEFPLDPLDRLEHSYLELGAWLGSQDLALRLMGLGTLLGLWQLLTPYTILGMKRGNPADEEVALGMAGNGWVHIQARP